MATDKRLTIGHLRELIKDLPDDAIATPCFEPGFDPAGHQPSVRLHGFGSAEGFVSSDPEKIGVIVYVSVLDLDSYPMELEECLEGGTHLSECDDDGYCQFCGEQQDGEDETHS